MMAFSAILEPFRAANHHGASPAYVWTVIGLDEAPIVASNGLAIEPGATPAEDPKFDRIVLVSGGDADRIDAPEAVAWLRREARRGAQIGAVADGAFFIARAGLLDGHACSIHWESEASFREMFPAVTLRPDLFVLDRNRFTSAGGISAFDMALDLIERDHGLGLSVAVSDWFVHDRARPAADREAVSLRARTGLSDPLMLQAVAAMEANLEVPLQSAEIAAQLNLARTTFERRFRAATGSAPMDYYRAMRLRRARDLVRRSRLRISEIAFACGFADAARFAQAYRRRFGLSPTAERRRPERPVTELQNPSDR